MEGFDGRTMLSHLYDSSLFDMMAEVDEPELQRQVLRIAASVVFADKHLSEGEVAMLDAIHRTWQPSPFAEDSLWPEIHRPGLPMLTHVDANAPFSQQGCRY